MKIDGIKLWIESKYNAKCNGTTHKIPGVNGPAYVDYKQDGIYVKTVCMTHKVVRYEDKWLHLTLASAIDDLIS